VEKACAISFGLEKWRKRLGKRGREKNDGLPWLLTSINMRNVKPERQKKASRESQSLTYLQGWTGGKAEGEKRGENRSVALTGVPG